MKKHNEFMKDVEYAKSLPAQSAHDLAPESQEDFAVYTTDEDKRKKELKYPDKFYCECGKEVSEETMACAGMCNDCYTKSDANEKENEQ